MTWLAIPTVATLISLSLLHVYWALGGAWGKQNTVPERSGKPVFRPGPLATWCVAGALAIAALLVAGLPLGWNTPVPHGVYRWGTVGVATAFLLRAVGDFRTVGLFRRVQDTAFARLDARIYTPLCLLLGMAAWWLAVGA